MIVTATSAALFSWITVFDMDIEEDLLHSSDDPPRWLFSEVKGNIGATRVTSYRDSAPLPIFDSRLSHFSRGWSRVATKPIGLNEFDIEKDDFQLMTHRVDDGFGWPWVALRCAWIDDGASFLGTVELEYGIQLKVTQEQLDAGSMSMRAIPLMPVWKGFVGNTLVAFIILRFLLLGIVSIRRTIRSANGRCPICAYDLLGLSSAGCPECGHGRGDLEGQQIVVRGL